MSQFYFRVLGEEFGPISLESLQQKIAIGQLSKVDEYRSVHETRWTQIADFQVLHPNQPNPSNALTDSDRATADGRQKIDTVEIACFDSPTQSANPTSNGVAEAVNAAALILHDANSHLPQHNHGPAPTAAIEATNPSVAQPVPAPVGNGQEPVAAETALPWYARMGQVERGPMDFQKLAHLASAGYLLPTDRVRQGVKGDWQVARMIPGLFAAKSDSFAGASPSALSSMSRPYVVQQSIPTPVQQKPRSASAPAAPPPAVSRAQAPYLDARYSASPQPASRVPISHDIRPTESRSHSVKPHLEPSPHPGPVKDTPHAHKDSDFDQPKRNSKRQKDAQRKHMDRRGHFAEAQLLGRRNLIILGCLAAAGALIAYMKLDRFPLAWFAGPCQHLEETFITLGTTWQSRPSKDIWQPASEGYIERLDSLTSQLKAMQTKREIRNHLVSAGESLTLAVKSYSADTPVIDQTEVSSHMQEARKYLDLAWSDLTGISKQPTKKKPKIPHE